ncbi:MAG: hypothetical protein WDZ74_00325 [Candidatus Paceibacterota bacterium]
MITHMPTRFLITLTFFLIGVPTVATAQSSFEDFPGAEELLEQYSNFGDRFSPSSIEDMVTNVNPLTLTYSPVNTKPGDRVTIRIQDFGKPTDSLFINWYIDGVLFSSGLGINSIAFNVGPAGVVSTVYAEITKNTGSVERTTPVIVGASHMDILWEAVDAQVPPFYKGKALPSWDTIIKTYAIPEVYSAENQQIPRSTFVYTWSKNQSPIDLNPQSGYGKDNVYVLADFARKRHTVGVDIFHANSGVSSFSSVAVKLHDAETLLYEKHPLEGVIFERALPPLVSQARSSGSLRVVAYPFGMDARNRGDVEFSWKLNGRTLSNTGTMRNGEIPLVSSEQGGISTIVVEARNREKPLQSSTGSLRINVE